ncbi:hypothetical protein Agub_g10081 [Astrephomene gubernaculifera]|uniref:Aminopeptidase P N-terminal domain-containing protein n=1 Tax=Astrephomene gubernaculifera TaxID=47775 RepID=A0AAD3DUG1_9CHLO|nr:hypothetical protein Agub_g10081 [Astrephomene gubernaculifera]
MFLGMVAGLRVGHRELAASATTLSSIAGLRGTILESVENSISLICNRQYSSRGPAYPAGQPIHATHPELIAPHELTPGIPASEYRARRQRLAALLPPGGAAILPAAATAYMSGVIPWPYRQDPDFFYLTGVMQHGLALITAPKQGSSSQEATYTLFIDPPSPSQAKWDGAGLSREVALEVFGADEVLYMHQMPRRLHDLASSLAAASASSPAVYAPILYDTDRTNAHHATAIAAALKPALSKPGAIQPLRPLMHSLRLIKSQAEAALMRTSAAVASAAVRQCMAVSAPGVTEYGLGATFEFCVKAAGAQRLAYPSVVAGGSDACTIHYLRADKSLPSGSDLLLMDAGAEYWGYVSDVSRTWPVGGRFSGPQRDVYAVVLEAHQRCLAACRPGSSIRLLHQLAVEVLSEGLYELRVLPGASRGEIQRNLYREFFWHSLGHYLGCDTHDTALIGHDRQLQQGAVITVEPGLYIPDHPRFGAFRGIGVRIEDDVLVTASGCRVLSDQAPVTIPEVEELVGSAREAAAGAAAAGGGDGWRLPLPPRFATPPHRALEEGRGSPVTWG